MGVLEIIAIIDGLVSLGIRLADTVELEPGTPEEQTAKLAALKAKLQDTHAQVMAWTPKEV